LKYLSPPNGNKLLITSEKDKWTEVSFFLKKLGDGGGLANSISYLEPKNKTEENYENITKTVIAERLSQRSCALSRRSIYSANKLVPVVEVKKSSFMLKIGKSESKES
jgi:hypothetical protein